MLASTHCCPTRHATLAVRPDTVFLCAMLCDQMKCSCSSVPCARHPVATFKRAWRFVRWSGELCARAARQRQTWRWENGPKVFHWKWHYLCLYNKACVFFRCSPLSMGCLCTLKHFIWHDAYCSLYVYVYICAKGILCCLFLPALNCCPPAHTYTQHGKCNFNTQNNLCSAKI